MKLFVQFSFAVILGSALLISSCDEASFRTSLPDIPGVLTEMPDGYAGTFWQCNDSLFQVIEKSGKTAEEFLVSALENNPATSEDYPVYSVFRHPDHKRVIFSNLLVIPASRIDSGSFKSGYIKSWTRVLDNLIQIQTTGRTNNDTTILMPVWQDGRLYMGLDLSRRNSEEDLSMEGYEIVAKLPDPEHAAQDNSLTPALLKEHNGSHYLILSLEDSLFEINQYHLTDKGFTRRVIPYISSYPEATSDEQREFLNKLERIRKITPADTAGNSIVLNPNRKHLDPLFNSEFAETSYFMRITPASPWLTARILIWALSTALVVAIAAFLLKGRGEKAG